MNLIKQLIYSLPVSCILIVVNACQNKSEHTQTMKYLSDQITERTYVLNQLIINGDSMNSTLTELDKNISKFILVSKDIENLNASIRLSNTYFKEQALKYQLNYNDFEIPSGNFSLDELEIMMKQNQLNLLNQLIFKYSKDSNLIYTAH